MDNQFDDQQQPSVIFLLEEYRYLTESFLRNEELGERRVNFFITLTTAVIGGLAAIWKVSDGGVDPKLIGFGLVAVLLFGIITLVRIIRRNLVTDEYLRGLGRIRKYFADRDPKRDPEIQLFLPYPPYDDKARTKEWKDILSPGTGGLVEMVALVNSFILAALFMLLAHYRPWWVIVPLGLIGFVVAWFYQFVYVMYRYDRQKKKIKQEIKFPRSNGD